MKNKSTHRKFCIFNKNWKSLYLLIFLFFSTLFSAQNVQTFNTPGSTGSWTVPPGVTSISVEAWGGGGRGGTRSTNGTGGGGGAGAYSLSTISVNSGDVINFTVGTGSTSANNSGTDSSAKVNNSPTNFILAKGGSSVANNSTNGATGGLATQGIGTTRINGGAGANSGTNGGNGGDSPNGGAGGGGATGNANGSPGNNPGGGGGGAKRTSGTRNGGNGGNGQIKITYTGYCAPVSSLNSTYINSLSTSGGTIDINNQNSGASAFPYGYQNFYDTNAMTIDPGSVFNITYGVFGGRSNVNTGVAIWIDWDKNNIFELSERIYIRSYFSTNNPITTGDITIPAGAVAGNYVMRIVYDYNNASPDPCTLSGGATRGEAEDYKIIIPPPCISTPVAGTASITPATGAPSSTFNVSVTGSSASSGLSYQWQVSEDGSTNWTDISGATSANATLTAVSLSATQRFYRRKITCNSSGLFSYSNTVKFTTAATSYCNGTTQNPNALYINSVAIVGTMADPPVNNTGAGFPLNNGYSNYTNLASIAQQAQGEGVNVLASVMGNTLSRGRWKAWVDWNGNGTFEDSELVYTTGGIVSATANFGFAVPVNQDPGNYRMRIRVNNGIDFFGETLGFNFNPCENFTNGGTFGTSNYGETEDYLITVISNCSAKIKTVTDGVDCNAVGGKQITLQASSSEPVTEFRWYTTATGPDYTVSLPDGSGTATTFVTPNLSATAIYYVTAFNGNCESTFRIPVTAEIKPTPEITFTPSTLEICGEAAVIAVSATGGNEIKYLIEKQTFEDAAPLGDFTIQNNINITPVAQNNRVNWQKRQSVYIPKNSDGYLTWYSAISSGFGGNKFVMATSDVNPNGIVDKALLSKPTLDSRGLTSLTLKFKMFFSRYQADGTFPDSEFVSVEVSTTNSANNTGWTKIDQITSDVGKGSAFEEKTYDLTDYVGIQNLRLRIRYYADGWFDGVAVDDIELYGEKPLQPSFAYVPSNPIGIYTDSLGTIPYGGGPIETVYFKPSSTEIESYANWNVTATATLTNSCNAQGTLNIVNNTKVWNPASATFWSSSALWKPGSGMPTLDKCVIIKKPILIDAGTAGLAKNIKIETASGNNGQLTISGSLTVNDVINNTGNARNLIVKSDGNLLQVDDSVVNETPVAVRRIFTWSDNDRKEYNYISSPVYNQNMKMIFSDDIPTSIYSQFVTVLNEPTSMFVNAKDDDYKILAKGFSVKEPKSSYNGATGISKFEAEYKGVPNNGIITLPLAWSGGNRGYNVAGNPYPSNIDIVELYQNSLEINPANATALDTTFQFWDNVVNHTYTQLGGSYKGYSYALYNVESGEAIYAPGHDPNGPDIIGTKTPSRIVKTDQAFMVRALAAGATLEFNNAIRKTDRNTVFFGKNPQRDAYHLEMITAEGLGVQNAIVYMPTGSANYGREDSKLPSSTMSDALFSFAGETKIVINGRSLFTNDDVITLGTRHFVPGTYIIRANDLKGIFANGQAIYLKDKQLNILTDISVAEYAFTSDSGEFNNRFEIVYKPEVVLGTGDTAVKANIQVYRDAQDFVVQSSAKKITSYELYDMSGRIIMSQKTNAKEIRFDAERLVDGAYILKGQLEDGEVFTKKLRK